MIRLPEKSFKEEKEMLDIKLITENPELVKERLAKKGCIVDFTEILKLDSARKKLMSEIEALKAERNKVSAEIPKYKKEGKPVEEIFARMRTIGDEITEGDAKINAYQQEITDFIAKLPNMPDDDLLPGEKENNKVIKVFGEKPEFDFKPKNHVDLCTDLGIIDYERGVKLSGNGYWLYRGDGARLEWALLNYFVATHLKDGYEMILPPHMLGYNCGFGAGQFPKFTDEVYWVDSEDGEKKTVVKNEAVAMKHAMGYVSKDRDTESLALSASIKDNIAIAGMGKYAVGKFIIWDPLEKKYVDEQIESLSIKCSDRNQIVNTLSGGNKQKVVFGKWVGCGSEILILDCPTRGVDIGVKQAMYQLMVKLKQEGKAILLISEEMPELMGMSDRILIMKDGEIKKEFLRSKDLSDADIIGYMI